VQITVSFDDAIIPVLIAAFDFTNRLNRIEAKIDELNRIEAKIDALSQAQNAIMATFTDLKTQVQRNTDLENSAVQLIQGISAQLKDAIAQNDPAAVQMLADQLSSSADSLAAAITANTPVAAS